MTLTEFFRILQPVTLPLPLPLPIGATKSVPTSRK
jgi:hypothetical protein